MHLTGACLGTYELGGPKAGAFASRFRVWSLILSVFVVVSVKRRVHRWDISHKKCSHWGMVWGRVRNAKGVGVEQGANMTVDFRYVRKHGSLWDGWNEEGRLGSPRGRSISSYALHIFEMCDILIGNAFPEVKQYWKRIQVPCGRSVELVMVCNFRAREFAEQNPFRRVTAYREFATKTNEFLLVEVYGSYWLWFLSSEMTQNICRLDQVTVLGSRANADEVERLLRFIEHPNFATLP